MLRRRLFLLAASLATIALIATAAHAAQVFGAKRTPLKGKFRALVVWVQDYQHWTPLSAPKKDAERVAKALTEHYIFESADVAVLGNPTQAEMFTAIKAAAAHAGKGDSLLIFYAGHGYLEKATGHGYWIPKDGKAPGPAAELSYLSSTWVRDVLKGSKALHVAVVSDACFSGALLGSRGGRDLNDAYYGKMYKRRSFEGLTSGALETVNDAGAPGGHSPFAYYLAQALETPSDPVFDLADVFQRVRQGVKQYSPQTPVFGLLTGAPSDGGAFVFVARKALVETSKKPPAKPEDVEPDYGYSTAPDPREVQAAYEEAKRGFREKRYDDALAIATRQAFCDNGHLLGCQLIGLMYEQGFGMGKDPVHAKEAFTKANALATPTCQGKSKEMESCYILGSAYRLGRAVAADGRQASKFLQQACALSHTFACYDLAAMMAAGKLVAANPGRAAPLYAKACRLGAPDGCFQAGRVYSAGKGVKADDQKAAGFYKQACEGGNLEGCGQLGAFLLSGRGVAKNGKLGAALLQRACDGGSQYGCVQLGYMYHAYKEHRRASAFWSAACRQGEPMGCHALGDAIIRASGSMVSSKAGLKAAPYFKKACDAGLGESCHSLGKLYNDGSGVDWDSDKAKALIKRGCDLGFQPACTALEEL